MNLIEAIKSGVPFRRPTYLQWMLFHADSETGFVWQAAGDARFPPADILADDWEIREESISLTRTQFWKAAGEALRICAEHEPDHVRTQGRHEMAELARILGFEK